MRVSNKCIVALMVCVLAGMGTLGCNTVTGGNALHNAGDNIQTGNEHSRPHTITAKAEPGGSISPPGSTSVPRGSSQTFIATANAGYRVADVLIDGRSVGAVPYLYRDHSSSYTFNNVAANHVISALFDVNERL